MFNVKLLEFLPQAWDNLILLLLKLLMLLLPQAVLLDLALALWVHQWVVLLDQALVQWVPLLGKIRILVHAQVVLRGQWLQGHKVKVVMLLQELSYKVKLLHKADQVVHLCLTKLVLKIKKCQILKNLVLNLSLVLCKVTIVSFVKKLKILFQRQLLLSLLRLPKNNYKKHWFVLFILVKDWMNY